MLQWTPPPQVQLYQVSGGKLPIQFSFEFALGNFVQLQQNVSL